MDHCHIHAFAHFTVPMKAFPTGHRITRESRGVRFLVFNVRCVTIVLFLTMFFRMSHEMQQTTKHAHYIVTYNYYTGSRVLKHNVTMFSLFY